MFGPIWCVLTFIMFICFLFIPVNVLLAVVVGFTVGTIGWWLDEIIFPVDEGGWRLIRLS